MKGFEMDKANLDQNTTPPMSDLVAVISGGFDPIHAGHLSLIRSASTIGKVHILLNSDQWLKRKKGRAFLSYGTRADILSEFLSVHAVSPVDDEDGSVVKGLKYVQQRYAPSIIAFLNGGDRKQKNTPERDYCVRYNIELMWNIGGEKQASSSELLEAYAYNFPAHFTTTRSWGEYEVFGEGIRWKGKILRVNPGCCISLQRHFNREERWIIVEGEGEIWVNETISSNNPLSPTLHKKLEPIQVGSIVEIAKKEYHWFRNTSSTDQLVIVEAWLGEQLNENDIERVDYDATSIFIEK